MDVLLNISEWGEKIRYITGEKKRNKLKTKITGENTTKEHKPLKSKR